MQTTLERHDSSLDLAAVPSSVAVARSFISAALDSWSAPTSVIDDAVLVVSELATNALALGYAANLGSVSRIQFHLCTGSTGRVRIEVTDHNHRDPTLKHPSSDDETGRGLFLIDALSADWGHFRHADTKTVWAELDCATCFIPQPRRSTTL